MAIKFNEAPYYDDFDETKKFYKIMFKPGYAVQTRELNQLQSILQGQIKTHGKHIFKEGSMVIPGNSSVDTDASFVKFVAGTVLPSTLVGKTLTGGTSGVTALVIKVGSSTNSADLPTLYVKYTNSGSSNQKVFSNGESISDGYTAVLRTTAAADATGFGSLASVESGFYFIKDTFVYVASQTVELDKYSNTPSYKIGLEASEKFLDSEEDVSLLDNAQGVFNYNAPGADRYQINLILTKKNVDIAKSGSFIVGESYTILTTGDTDFISVGAKDNNPGTEFTAIGVGAVVGDGSGSGTATVNEKDFIQLIIVQDGKVLQKISTTEYSILEQTLARRTFDESGDYTVRNFPVDVREYRNNDRGNWAANTIYLADDVVLSDSKYYRCRKDGTSNTTAPHTTLATATPPNIGSTTELQTGVIWTYESSPFFNRGVYNVVSGQTLAVQNANKSKLALGLEPGKAYVKGYEIEKISTTYLEVSKARTERTQTEMTIPATVGNHVIVTNMNYVPDVTKFPLVKLHNQLTTASGPQAPVTGGVTAVEVGTARIRYVELDTQGLTPYAKANTRYKVSLFDIKMNTGYNFNRDVKQLFITGATNGKVFTADIFSIRTKTNVLEGSFTVTANGTTDAVSASNSIFSSELKVGDYIQFDNTIDATTGLPYRRRVMGFKVGSENSVLSISPAIPVAIAGQIASRVETTILEPENESLIFPLTYPYVSEVIRDRTTYQASQVYLNKNTDAGTTITITTTDSDVFSSTTDADNYLVINDSTGAAVTYGIGTAPGTGSGTGTLIITGLATGTSHTVIANIIRKNTENKQKTKTLATSTITFDTADQAKATKNIVTLNKTDGFRLLSVKTKGGTWATPTGTYSNDITSRYDFDGGQKSTHYDLCNILLNPGESAPTAPYQVTFEHFTHSAGDYFNVNSYLGTVSYEEIPSYNGIPLSYVYDFRPKVDDDGVNFSSTSLIPKRGADINSDFKHYLGRKDKLALNQNGSFYVVTGTSDIVPNEPSDSSATGMVLYKLTYQPYTYSTSSLIVQSIDNKRYTMRDIGRLEKRIDNIEYYTSLSMLEQASQSLEITDEFGLNRFKNGFVVDNFTGVGVGDITSPDYRCAIDMENGLMRPTYYMDNVNLIELNKFDSARTSKGYQVTGDIITLPIEEEVELVKQMDASRVENINPFAIFTFIGNIDLNPPSDEWFEVNRLPDIVTNVEGDFNALYHIAERSGALNTVWNAWQTQWSGTPTSARQTISADRRYGDGGAALDARFGNRASGSGWAARTVVVDVVSTQVGQSRTGIKTDVVPRIDRTTTADRTLSTAVIPYIRARSLLFVVRGLKPNTTFTPFFDSVNINPFTTQSIKITIPRNSYFSSTISAGGDSSEIARLVNGNSESALNKGDVVYVKSRGGVTKTKDSADYFATGVLALVVNPLNGSTTELYLVNVRGTFAQGDQIAGSITEPLGAVGIVSSVPSTLPTKGGELKSNQAGDLVGIFDIPNTDSNRFRTGVREFKLSDSVTDAPDRTSVARAQYRAEGIIETKQASVTATRNGELVQNVVNENQTIIQTSDRVVSDTGWYDPLAQTFLVDSVGGAFITSVDIFFATRDASIPVRMQIREVVNGYPGKVILPFSQVTLTPDKVNIASTTVTTTEGETYPKPVATNFKFTSPVYLNDKTEYAIVLLSDSNSYRAWISQLGDTSVVNDRIISEQPYAGVLFKSQNASTWTANQNQDLMFKIYKAKFNTSVIGDVDFVNADIPTKRLANNPIFVKTGSSYVRVTHENHGKSVGYVVTISGATDIGGITANDLNGHRDIVSADSDSYVIQAGVLAGNTGAGTEATLTGSGGGNSVFASDDILYNTIQPIVQHQVFQNTDITYTLGMRASGSYQQVDPISIAVNQNNSLELLAMIGNTKTQTDKMAGAKYSAILNAKLRSLAPDNKNISPVIDTARLSLITIQDRINSPTLANVNYAAIDDRAVTGPVSTIGVAGTDTFITSNAIVKAAFLTVNVGRYIKVSGFASPAAANNGTWLVTEVASDGSYIKVAASLTAITAGATGATAVSIVSSDRFVDEIAPFGSSSIAKYVTKKINLQNTDDNATTFLKVRFAADNEQYASIKMYYKLQLANSNTDFSKTPYILANPTKAAVVSNDGAFTDVEYNIANLPEFTAVQIKLVINSTYGADVVRVRDLQIIGCA
jgi:hypothetical protein